MAGLPAALAAAMTVEMAKQDTAPQKPRKKSRLADTDNNNKDNNNKDDNRACFDRPALQGETHQQHIGFVAF